MIPRYQRILFAVLVLACIGMSAILWNHHRHNYSLRDEANTDAPIEAPSYAAAESVTLALANDTDGSITPTTRDIALPSTPAVRVRALLEHLLAEYTSRKSPHPLGGGVAVEDAYLIDLPLSAPAIRNADGSFVGSGLPARSAENEDPLTHATGQLAIINLRSAWCDAHPSGITVETLTIDSILGTLHAAMPEVTEVRFLVDGQPRSTLAGNVELDRTYDVVDTSNVVTPVSHE